MIRKHHRMAAIEFSPYMPDNLVRELLPRVGLRYPLRDGVGVVWPAVASARINPGLSIIALTGDPTNEPPQVTRRTKMTPSQT